MKPQTAKSRSKPTPAIPQGSPIQEKPVTGTPVPKTQPMFDNLHARITVRAYELYVERRCREGYAEQDWLDAEREIVNQAFPV